MFCLFRQQTYQMDCYFRQGWVDSRLKFNISGLQTLQVIKLSNNKPLKSSNHIPEDEKHFICICPTYDVYRENMYDNITLSFPNFTLLDNENKFLYVMSCNDKCVPDFVDIAWSKRIALLCNWLFYYMFYISTNARNFGKTKYSLV